MITAICKSIRGLWVLLLMLFTTASAAHNKVVVVTLGGDDAISHPVAKTFTNSIGMQFNELPAGSFTMGSYAGFGGGIGAEPGRDIDEVQHIVTLSKAFNMQVTEVTNEQWNNVITDLGGGSTNPSTSHTGDNYPVETISWYDAVFFANTLSTMESRSLCYILGSVTGTLGSIIAISSVTMNTNCTGYRLPTEAEWEYAARGGLSITQAYGNPIDFDHSDTETGGGFNGNLHAMGWYSHNNTSMGYTAGTKPVAKKQANDWGLYDMHGNVFEWNWDRYATYSGNASDPSGPASGSSRVIRGGGWVNDARGTRSANRVGISVGEQNSDVGFRLVSSQGQ